MSHTQASVRKALANPQLGAAVLRSCKHSLSSRDWVMSELEDLDSRRDQARAVRQDMLDNHYELLLKFIRSFQNSGGVLHQAEDAFEARMTAVRLLRERGLHWGVKSKSMVSEEIELSRALTEAGIDAVESDLGEFIVQLAGEPPSHITAPALHKTRAEIGKLFEEKLGLAYTDDPTALARAARVHLRKRFVEAEFGIAGANFLIAETGHIIIVENEGNARMGTAIPSVLVVVTGIEKVVRDLSGLAVLLQLLGRSATGQRFPGGINLIRPGRYGEDGPRELHLILVDNGRRQVLTDPTFQEMMLCVRCGACLNICPVYRTVGGHAYESVYPGPMGAVLSNLLGPDPDNHRELPYLSTLCGACREVCPVKIDLPRMLLELRSRADKPFIERTAAATWSYVMSNQARLGLVGWMVRHAAGILPKQLFGGWLKAGEKAFREKQD
ncbi:MAG: lactate utilization protein B [Calditrichota bacterium]